VTQGWRTLSLGDPLLAEAELARIRRAVEQASAGDGVAVFLRHETRNRLHCAVCLYFSPAAGPLAASFDAEPCSCPPREGLSLYAGDRAAWRTWFPEPSE